MGYITILLILGMVLLVLSQLAKPDKTSFHYFTTGLMLLMLAPAYLVAAEFIGNDWIASGIALIAVGVIVGSLRRPYLQPFFFRGQDNDTN